MKYLRTTKATGVAASVALALLLVLTGCGSDASQSTPTQATVTTPSVSVSTVTVTESPSSSSSSVSSTSAAPHSEYREADAPGDGKFERCADGVGITTDVTSCPFAENVRRAYRDVRTDAGARVRAHSPVTNRDYTMSCLPGVMAITRDGQHRAAVHCVGGNNAEVLIF